MIKIFCMLLTVMMLCFTNICMATNWTWVNSDDIDSEYIDLDSIEPKIYAGEPTQVSVRVKVERGSIHKRKVVDLTFDYINRVMYIKQVRIDDMVSGITEGTDYGLRNYPVTIRRLNKYSDFYWYVKDKFTGRNDFARSLGKKRLMFAGKYKMDKVEMNDYIDTMSIQENDNLIQFDIVTLYAALEDVGYYGSVGVLQYTKDGKRSRYKKYWATLPSPDAEWLAELAPADLGPFKDVDIKRQSNFELAMRYYNAYPEKIGNNVLE